MRFDGVGTMDYWARAPRKREQTVLFAPTLDAMIPEDHPVRLFDEILALCDWSGWEAEYHLRRGQPPIHPRVVAGVILYGLTRGLRSSRLLEYLTAHNIDFIWLAEGHHLDHSTICGFRKKFRKPLKTLFRQIGRIAINMGLIRLNEVGLDGTRVKANNGRSQTLKAEGIEQRLAALDEQLEQMLREAEEADAGESRLFDTGESASKLPPQLAEAKARQEELRQALAKVQAADRARAREGIDPKKNPAQIPATDPDSKVLPNKEGGYAPNYTPMAATDAHRGFIVDADVIPSTWEHLTTVDTVDRIEENFGRRPDTLLADPAHATGPNMEQLEARQVEFFTPVKSNQPQPGNPALRDNPSEPVAEPRWEQLPRNPQTKKLDKSAFVYDDQADVYYCPQGKALAYEQTKSKVNAAGERIYFRVYRSPDCHGCPLNQACRSEKAKRARSVSRDVHEDRRERMAAKMAREDSQAVYRKRLHTAETPFAVLKQLMNLRQFLLRGLENVKTEWLWACTAFNVAKLVRETARLRAKFAALAAEGAG
jgi:transposase